MTNKINLLNEAFGILARYSLVSSMDIELRMRIENHYKSLEGEENVSYQVG
ncbi:hypothetical protein [Peribacillus loiseleuriae]|uniref:hypothetical protein n=1 Tax=Peribacillus loiseleuriae TaxID=1679170 RepID=UPI000AD372CD|nr:hypothetical protein [Peribacillus loiseleuriae]